MLNQKPTRIELEMYGHKFIADNLPEGMDGSELLDYFKRLMVLAGYPPYVLDNEEGHWKWVSKDEGVV